MFALYKYDTTDSTNTEAKRLLQNGGISGGGFKVPAVVVADKQEAGRGRQGKSFFSPGNTGLYMSVVDKFPTNEQDAMLLTVRASMAVSEAIFECTGVRVGIKWVNDLYLGNRKICGILTESVVVNSERYLIIGVGINVSTVNFPQEISEIAGSLGVQSDFAKSKIDQLCQKVAENILSIKMGAFCDLKKYREHSVVLGKEVEYEKNGNHYSGIAVEITETGGLVVELNSGGMEILRSGEISLKKWGF